MPPSKNSEGGTLPGQQDVLNIHGFIRTIDFVPTAKPKGFSDSFYIVSAGGSSKAYIYDTNPGTLGWKGWTIA